MQYQVKEEVDILPFTALPELWESSWIEIVKRRGFNPTLHPDWLRVVLNSWGIDTNSVRVFIEHNGTSLSSIIPYMAETKRMLGLPLRVISLSSCLVSYHAEIVCMEDAKTALRVFLTNLPTWDRVIVPAVIDDGPTAQAVRDLCAEKGWRVLENPLDISPYLPLEGNFQELVASKGSKFRYNHRKRNEALASSNEMRLVWYRASEHVEEFLRAFIEVEASSWKANSSVDVSASNREGRYYSQLLPFLAANNALLANVLWFRDQPIAYSLCCHWGTWIGQLKTGFNTSFAELSPGALVIDGCIEEACIVGAKEFDFLGTPGKKEAEPHKLRWTKQVRHHVWFEIFSNRIVPSMLGLMKQVRDRFIK